MGKEEVARPGRFELPTFWFVGRKSTLQQTTTADKSQRNQQKQPLAFGWFRLALYPIHGHLHGHFSVVPLASFFPRNQVELSADFRLEAHHGAPQTRESRPAHL